MHIHGAHLRDPFETRSIVGWDRWARMQRYIHIHIHIHMHMHMHMHMHILTQIHILMCTGNVGGRRGRRQEDGGAHD